MPIRIETHNSTEEIASLERKIIDRFDWLEERLEWISQQLESVEQGATGIGAASLGASTSVEQQGSRRSTCC